MSDSTSSNAGHAQQVAQAQGLKLDTTASNQTAQAQDSSSSSGGGLLGRVGSIRRPGGLSEDPNARSKTMTLAEGENTFGVSALSLCYSIDILSPTRLTIVRKPLLQALNRHPGNSQPAAGVVPPFRVGVSEDRNKKCRRTMEDSHSFVYNFGGVRGQGYFAVFE